MFGGGHESGDSEVQRRVAEAEAELKARHEAILSEHLRNHDERVNSLAAAHAQAQEEALQLATEVEEAKAQHARDLELAKEQHVVTGEELERNSGDG